jgi:hypothetical protein
MDNKEISSLIETVISINNEFNKAKINFTVELNDLKAFLESKTKEELRENFAKEAAIYAGLTCINSSIINIKNNGDKINNFDPDKLSEDDMAVFMDINSLTNELVTHLGIMLGFIVTYNINHNQNGLNIQSLMNLVTNTLDMCCRICETMTKIVKLETDKIKA